MLTLRDFMEVVDYRITEGSEFGWQCFGPAAHRLDSWTGRDHGGREWTVSVVFDRDTQTVYQFEVHDYDRERSYRWTHPEFVKAYRDEAQRREVDGDQAWDHVKFVDLETREDILEKTQAIVDGEDYDTRVSIPLDLPDDVLFTLMRQAHDRDITLNQLFEEIIRDAIRRHGIDIDELD